MKKNRKREKKKGRNPPASQTGEPPTGAFSWKSGLQLHCKISASPTRATFIQLAPSTHSSSASFVVHTPPGCMSVAEYGARKRSHNMVSINRI